MFKSLLVGAGVFLAGLVLGGFLLGQKTIERVVYGGASGTEHSNFEFFRSGLGQGGSVLAYTGATTPMVAADLCNNRLITYASGASGAVTLPSSTAVFGACLQNPGDFITTVIHNTSSTGQGGSFTLQTSDAASTLQSASGTPSTYVVVGGSSGLLYSLRSTSGTTAWLYHFFIPFNR